MDFKFALRSLRRTPGFAVLSILILALGIGANTAIFSVVHGVILRPLAYRDPDRLVSISMSWPGNYQYGQVSGPDFLDFESQTSAFASMAAYDDEVISIFANGHSEFAGASEVSPDFFKTLGVQPIAGRAFVSSDFGKTGVALVSEGFWRRHFGQMTFSSGHSLRAIGAQIEIVGILPAGFHFPESSHADVWAPFSDVLKNTNRGGHNYHVIARLKQGVPLEQAQAQLSAIASRLEKAYPGTNKNAGVYATSLTNFTVRRVKTSLYILLAAVALVLLIACANIANLLLARGAGRLRELAIRAAIGASRPRIIRHLLAETLLLAAAGSLGGVLFAETMLPVLLRLVPGFVPRLEQVQIDWAVLLFCAASGFASCLLFGVAPAMQASRVDPNRALRAGGSRGVVGGAAAKLRQLFVTAEVALCMVLLVSAGLLLRSFSAMTSVDMGFRPAHLLVAHISVPSGDGRSATEKVLTPLLDKLATSPQIESATIMRGLPGDPDTRSNGDYIIGGQTLDDMTTTAPQAGFSVVSGSYFQTLATPLLAGRTFSGRDNATAPPVAIISQALARRSFPKQDPIGQKILCGFDNTTMKWMTIVGVAADSHLDGPTETPMPELYLPYRQHPGSDSNVVVKTRMDPLALAKPVRDAAQLLDNEATLKFTTMESHMAEVVATPRFSSSLIGVFAGLAMLLACIGIYGVIAYSVTQRTAEIGLRMALGADRANVLRMVLAEAMKLSGVGLVIGSAVALMAARFLQSQLFEVSPSDPRIYLAMFVLLTSAALAASYVPAWRASRVEPLEALRQE
ncbi:MAG: ABC transporter permease [Acidobacteriota bacterium]|nr:ABC transporter permease [Acidobacteriota bacterium]